MAILMSRQKVKDYAAWESIFLERDGKRQESGQKTYRILRDEGDANNLVVLNEWDTLENAHKYASSSGLGEAMSKAGVIESEVYFLEEVAGSDAK